MTSPHVSNSPDYQSYLEHMFEGFLLEQGASAKTRRNYKSDLKHFLLFAETQPDLDIATNSGDAAWLDTVTSGHILDYMRTQLIFDTPIATINRRLSALRMFFSFASTRRWVQKSPMGDITNIHKQDNLASIVNDNEPLAKTSVQRQTEYGALESIFSPNDPHTSPHANPILRTKSTLRPFLTVLFLLLSLAGSTVLALKALEFRMELATVMGTPKTTAEIAQKKTRTTDTGSVLSAIAETPIDTSINKEAAKTRVEDRIQATDVTTDTLQAQEASIGGTLYAHSIQTSFGTLTQGSPASELFLDEATRSALIAEGSTSALTALGASLTGTSGEFIVMDKATTFTKSLAVLADTLLGQTTIAGSAFIDGLIHLSKTGIQTLGGTLYFQQLRLGAIDFMNGIFTIDTSGTTSITGPVKIATLSPLSDAITIHGDLTATGSATFKGNLTASSTLIATHAAVLGNVSVVNEPSTVPLTTNDTIGTSVLPSDISQVYVPTIKALATSRIYITPVSSTANQVLYVREVIPGEGFVAAIEAPIAEDITFNWWIIN